MRLNAKVKELQSLNETIMLETSMLNAWRWIRYQYAWENRNKLKTNHLKQLIQHSGVGIGMDGEGHNANANTDVDSNADDAVSKCMPYCLTISISNTTITFVFGRWHRFKYCTHRFAMDWMHGKYNASYDSKIILKTGHNDANPGK